MFKDCKEFQCRNCIYGKHFNEERGTFFCRKTLTTLFILSNFPFSEEPEGTDYSNPDGSCKQFVERK